MSVEALNLSQVPGWRRWLVQWDMSHNAIPLAFFAFTAMWQTAAQHFGMVHVPPHIWYVLYGVSCVVLAICAVFFILRVIIFPAAVAADFNHPRLVNFFFMPVMIGALCVLTTPPLLRSLVQFRAGFYILSTYQLALSLYLYGEWLFGAQPTAFIHPLVFMQTIGFFLLSNIGATAHLVDQANAMFALGCLFWLLVFITNFQHVALALDKQSERPQPTFFLFIAPPAQAAVAMVVISAAEQAAIQDPNSSTLLQLATRMDWPKLAAAFMYIDLYLYLLMFRLFPTFWTSKFAVTWWAYIFPLSAAAGTTIWRYKSEGGMFWGVVAVLLSLIASAAMLIVFCSTIWALSTNRVPHNPSCLATYHRYYTRHSPPNSIDATFSA